MRNYISVPDGVSWLFSADFYERYLSLPEAHLRLVLIYCMTALFFQTQRSTQMMMTFQNICLGGIPKLMDIQFSFAPDAFSQTACKKYQ